MKKRRIAALLALACICSTVMGTGCTSENGGNKRFSAEYGKTVPKSYTVSGHEESEEELVDQSAENIRKFAVESSEKIFPKVEGNYLYSPASLYMGLQLCGSITAENSAEDLMGLLGVKDREELRLSGNALIRDLTSDQKGEILKISNSVWMDTALLPEISEAGQEVISQSAEALGADVYHEPLMDSATQKKIDSWISDRTDKMIGKMPVKPDSSTAMILFNTLYFNKDWKRKNDSGDIQDADFWIDDNNSVDMTWIRYDKKNYPYVKTDHATASAAAYADDSYVIFIKPDYEQSLETVMSEDLKDVIDAYANDRFTEPEGNVKVLFGIPMIDYEVKVDFLRDTVEEMGVSSVMAGGAFSDIDPDLFVSQIAQDCRIIMDQEGTKAAAVTEFVMTKGASVEEDEKIVDLCLNREYAYVIMSKDDIPLFIGAVRDPRKG
ncbi:MAG: hypothetical protein J5825_03565 [Lachnospiraceae bacterium]|nr:hypothetical protein [Lachnospiraceae bacterium]